MESMAFLSAFTYNNGIKKEVGFMKKRLLTMFLALSMVVTMTAGCARQEKTPPAGQNNAKTSGTAKNSDNTEMKKIVVGWMTLAPMDSKQTDAVEKAVNEIAEKKIGTHVDIQFYDPKTYGTQIPLMLQSNEKLDLMMYTPVPGASYDSFKNQKQLKNISDLLDKYGSDVKSATGDLLKGTMTADGIYAVPANRIMATDLYAIMRKDILDKLRLTEKAKNMKTWTEYKDILKKVVAKTDLAGVANCDAEGSVLCINPYFLGSDKFSENTNYDPIGDTYNLIYADSKTDKVGCYYFSDEFAKASKRANDWYKDGLIYKDAATSQDMGNALIKNNVAFSTIEGSELGVEQSMLAQTGHEVICTKILKGILTTQSTSKFGFAVPVTATEPEAAVKFLNLLYSDSDIENTLAWGLKGRDWVEKDGQATYPKGVTAQNVAYHTADFLNGNQFIILPWDGSGADFRNAQKKAQEDMQVSKYVGFSFDSSGVESELTACFNVSQTYKSSLSSGSANNYQATLKEFKDKLKAAGIDKVIAAYQKQLDAWLAKK
jgi:putative aldouronate transport system substrate-binding protein